MRKGVFLTLFFVVLGITLSGQTTRVRLKQLELAPDTLFRYVIIADTSTQVAEWAKLDSLGFSTGNTLYLRGDAGTLSTLTDGDTIDIKTGSGLSTCGKTPDQILITLDSTGVTAGTYNFATVTVNEQGRITLITAGSEVDGSITNEGMLGVAAGGANSATLYTNTSGNVGTSIAGGWGVAISETTSANGGTITIAADSSQVATQYDISGFISGSGTSGRVPRFTGTQTISNGVLRDDGTLLALGGVTVSGYSFYDYSTGAWRLPAGTTAQQPTGQAGAIRYNTTVGLPEFHNGTRWGYIPPAAGALTSTRVPFVNSNGQLTDDADLTYTVASGDFNVAPGRIVTYQNTTTFSTFISGGNSTATGTLNVAVGTSAMQSLTTGSSNVALGSNSLRRNTTGSNNLAMGYEAMHGPGVGSLGSFNVAFGAGALYNNTGSNNIAAGYRAGYSNGATGDNIFIGFEAGLYSQTGANNVAIGTNAMRNTALFTAASNNTVIGYESGYSLATNSTGNVFLGYHAGRLATGSNQLFIENSNSTTPLVGGDFSTNVVGINTPIASIARTLHVTGEARITDLTTDTPTAIVGHDADGDLGSITVGSGLSLSAGTLTATGSGTMSSWTLAGTSGTPQTVSDGQTATIAAGFGVTTSAGATRTVTVTADTLNNPTLKTGNLSVAQNRSVTMSAGKKLKFSGSHSYDGGSWSDELGYASDFDAYGFYRQMTTTRGQVSFYMLQDYYPLIGDSLLFAGLTVSGPSSGYMNMNLNEDGTGGFSGIDPAGTKSAGYYIQDNGSITGYSLKLAGADGVESDVSSSGYYSWEVNNSAKMTLNSSGDLGIGDTSPEGKLDVNGVTKTNQIVGQGNNPSIATNANAGTGRSAALTTSQSSDLAGRGYLTTGTTLTAGEWFTMTWGTAYSVAPIVQIQCENANCATLMPYLYVVPTTTGVSVGVNVTGASYESKTYEFNYIVIGGK